MQHDPATQAFLIGFLAFMAIGWCLMIYVIIKIYTWVIRGVTRTVKDEWERK